MGFQRGQHRAGALFDQRKVFARAAHDRHPPHLARAELFGPALAGRQPAALHGIEGQPAAHLNLVDLLQPAIAEHRLGQPFVGEVFQQVGDEGLRRAIRQHRTVPVACLEIVDQRGGIVGIVPVGILQDRDDRRLDLGQRLARGGAVLPDEGNAAIAQQRAHFLRIGRTQCTIEREHRRLLDRAVPHLCLSVRLMSSEVGAKTCMALPGG